MNMIFCILLVYDKYNLYKHKPFSLMLFTPKSLFAAQPTLRGAFFPGLALLLSGMMPLQAQTATDPHEGMRLESLGAGQFALSWWGRAGWSYFILQSEDLIHWQYLPVIESGADDIIRWEFSSDTPRRFFKLRLSDTETEDPYAADFDGDGLGNWEELQLGLDPFKQDSAGDGTPDGERDGDADGLTNAQEKAQDRDLFWKDHPALELSVSAFPVP